MGVGGHKHHFNHARIEKEMENIGDEVRSSNEEDIFSCFTFLSN